MQINDVLMFWMNIGVGYEARISRFFWQYCNFYYKKVLRMHLLDKLIQLPKISIKQLEQKARGSHSNMSHYSSLNKQNQLHSKAIILVSPFYPKLQNHPPKCECHFHRLKKTHKLNMKKFRPKEELTETTLLKDNHSLQKDQKPHPSPPKNEINTQPIIRPYALNTHKINPQTLKPLAFQKQISFTMLKQQRQKLQSKRTNSQPKLFEPLTSNSFGVKFSFDDVSWKKHKKIDTTNAQFIAILTQRFQNDRYKSSYLKTLFSFIKMKTNIDKFYMWNSKAYLSNSLNLLLNHFSMSKLLKFQELQESEIQKIAFYMSCQNKQVKPILKELAQAVAEMQLFLAELKRKREANRLKALENADKSLQNGFQFRKNSYSGFNNDQKSADSLYMFLDDEREKGNGLSRKHSKVDIIVTEESQNQTKKRSLKGSSLNLRASALRSTLQYASNMIKTMDNNAQNQDKTQKEVNQAQNNLRTSQILGNLASINRSNRSTVFATINECRGESRQSSKLKKSKQSKSRKMKALKLPTLNDYDQKYSKIKYQKFCSKKEFSHLVEQIQRLDQNDEQRAQKLFNLLNVEQFLDDGDKIDLLVQTFAPLITDKCKETFLKNVVHVKDRKYIEKLSEQLDFLLGQIKRTDPRHFNNQDLCPYKQDPILKNSCNQRIIRCRLSRQDHSKIIKRMKTTYNQPEDKKEKIRYTEDQKDLQLEQAELKEIRAESLSPKLSQSIYKKCKTDKETVFIKPADHSNPQQKKILQYMHSKHHTTFNYLSNQISTLCSKLSQTDTNL